MAPASATVPALVTLAAETGIVKAETPRLVGVIAKA